MKLYFFLILSPLLILVACDKQELHQGQIVGTFEHLSTYGEWDMVKNIIVFNDDSTFMHQILRRDSLLLQEFGKWQFYSEDDGMSTSTNLTLFDFTVYIDHYSKEMVHIARYRGITAKKTFTGKIFLQVNIPFDPDGSPMTPKYKKVK